jgi:hypothetical protein
MTISNDYIAQTLHNDRAEELRREAATDRLARQAARGLRRRRRASRDRHPSPPIPRQRSASVPTAAKVA